MIRFGPSGNSKSFYDQGYKLSEQAPKWLAEMGLTAYEYSFGRGVNISEKKALLIKEACMKHNICISVHAPYYINLANPDNSMVEKSYGYLFASADCARLMGAERVVFHPASVGKVTRTEAFKLTLERTEEFLKRVHSLGYSDIKFCPETMGKINQIGNLEEIIRMCALDDVLYPTVDFGHLNARTLGEVNCRSAYENVLDKLQDSLSQEKVKHFHIHFSKIEYSKGGEVKHLTFEDNIYGPDFHDLAVLLKERKLEPVVICESDGTQAEDALKMMKIYDSAVFAEQEEI